METTTFEAALAAFLAAAQGKIDQHYACDFPTLSVPRLEAMRGARYVRVVRAETGGCTSRSAHCFVDTTNGNVLKAASWKAPAKGVRANIYRDDSGASGVTEYGAVYHYR